MSESGRRKRTGILGQADMKVKDSNDRGKYSIYIYIYFYADHK